MAEISSGDLEQRYREGWLQYYNQRRQRKTEGQGGSRTTIEKEHRHPKSLGTLRWAMGRESGNALAGGQAFLQFWVNPSECSWSQPLRSAMDKTSGGAVHYEYRHIDSTGSNLDLPTLNITFQAGIITPNGYTHVNHRNAPNLFPHGIANFYDFISLIDQPNVTSDGSPNFVNIMYVSPMHGGRGLWLRGFFTEDGINFTESVENPNTIQSWSASFLVCASNPPLNRLRQSFQAMGVKGA